MNERIIIEKILLHAKSEELCSKKVLEFTNKFIKIVNRICASKQMNSLSCNEIFEVYKIISDCKFEDESEYIDIINRQIFPVK